MNKFIQLKTNRLYFRELNHSDCESLFEIYRNEEAMKFRGSKPMTSIQDAKRMAENQQENTPEFHKSRFAICLRSNHELIGTFLVTSFLNKKVIEIGLSIDQRHWKNGYGSELLKSVCKTYPDNKLIAWCRQENIASIKLFQKAGFLIETQSQHPKSLLFVH